jgi:predicted lipid-binding transport protein (Tim44 family)
MTGLALLLTAGFAMLGADLAEARIGGGRSFGSRGTRTFNAPPATNTAPSAAPVQRSMTQKGATASPQNTGTAGVAAAQPSRFGGMRGLLMGGLFAFALGSIFGFGALASMLGFLLQFALIAGVIYLAISFFRNRRQPGFAQASAGGSAGSRPFDIFNRQSSGANGGGAASSSALKIGQNDLDSFERLLSEIQTSYGREDTEKLGAMVTPEMLSYFLEELSNNAKQGVRNEISGVKLLQGDLAEAWRENGSDYATVAIRYALIDAMVDRATGRVVSGDADTPTEATELWTFRRDGSGPFGGWQLSAIQQTGSATA